MIKLIVLSVLLNAGEITALPPDDTKIEARRRSGKGKRDRIQEILAQRFAVGQVYIKKIQYDLHREIMTFGPRMAHDDTIDALAYACKYAHPTTGLQESRDGWYKEKPKARNWITA